jgi:ATP/maltotriose-dependent transcriptional regulator MalT
MRLESRETGETAMARRRRIVARPRLIRALDGSPARVRALVAPAGYGKTTLVEQWFETDERRAAWYTARNASADVAVLSSGLAQAAATVIDGCDARLRERLTSTQNPADESALLAEMLAEDVADWPGDAWLVIDDYERICRATEAEEFVEVLASSAQINLFIASRQRPSWVSSRDILYGDVLELGQTTLAMTLEEAEEVLAEWPSAQASGLTQLADGWPAVVGLAGLTTAPLEINAELPDALYEYFAEEVYAGLDTDTRNKLALLAMAPSLDWELARAIVGNESGEAVCRTALASGILEERGGRLDFHPLARSFLESRVRVRGSERSRATQNFLDEYLLRRDWDAAFDLVERADMCCQLEPLMVAALTELLDGARLSTLELWCGLAERRGVVAPVFRVAEAEVALRQGRHVTAQALVEPVVRNGDVSQDVLFRALMLAGRAAHFGCREQQGLDFYRRAERAASTEDESRQARIQQVMCSGALELDEAKDILAHLTETAVPGDPVDTVRLVDRRLCLGFRFGYIDALEDARRAAELLKFVSDPVIRCSFRSTFAGALGLKAEYGATSEVAQELIDDALTHRIGMVLPHAYWLKGQALGGLRDFERAHEMVSLSHEESNRFKDLFGLANVYALTVRLLIQQGHAVEACSLELPAKCGIPSMDCEAIASRSLALACLGRTDEAQRMSESVRRFSRAIEVKVLTAAIDAVIAVRIRTGMTSAVEKLITSAFETGAIDMLVVAYRASADLLDVLLTTPTTSERTIHALRRSGDDRLYEGANRLARGDPIERLTTREREIHDFVAQGLSNQEIANRLVLSEHTIKLHLHHVYEKLGVHSRTALALNAAARRYQATLPTGQGDSDSRE